ncbi:MULTISPECIES: hypothetical protein [unclassified Streptomyces]|uniref:hypothetical protein n=1 Tax=unclassified Streptomyces TaxID=2593676 RepID=UPI002DDA4EBD|nr:hypothetical protein [Streptomyces sp. NBC_01761]WSC58005.1 hypothetical protein OG808_40495 [Streptomyces sp. NBC_01761]WSF89105.1 hypothetical protein OIE70_42040 [Streptomyces sp. NBC_01744]
MARTRRPAAVWRGGHGRRATGAVCRVFEDQLALQESVGQVQVPLVRIVTPPLMPFPSGGDEYLIAGPGGVDDAVESVSSEDGIQLTVILEFPLL